MKFLTVLSFSVVAMSFATLAHADRNEMKEFKPHIVQHDNNGHHSGWDKKKPVSVPEPTSFILLGLGLAGMGIAKKMRSRGE
jgi:hypothetical protein